VGLPTPAVNVTGRSSVAGPDTREMAMNESDARLWHPWLRINRVLRVMFQTRWSAEAWAVVRVEGESTRLLGASGLIG
jgi:hypothetical protein